jgi:hypothetical protein
MRARAQLPDAIKFFFFFLGDIFLPEGTGNSGYRKTS